MGFRKVNKIKGTWVEEEVRKIYGLKEDCSLLGDATYQDGCIVEIKSAELIFKEKSKHNGYVRSRMGRFSIRPDQHKQLPPTAKYIFVVTFKGHLLFAITLSKADVDRLIGKYILPTKKYKPLISEVADLANGYTAIKFFY